MQLSKYFFEKHAKLVICMFLLFQILLLLIYVFSATENIVYQDQLDLSTISVIEKFYNGNLKITDMWGV